jgi:hypothetical protein
MAKVFLIYIISQSLLNHHDMPKRSHRPLNPSPNFDFFINHCYPRVYETGIFAKLADNGLSGCSGLRVKNGAVFGGGLSLFNSFYLRQLCPPLLGLFWLAPGFVELD